MFLKPLFEISCKLYNHLFINHWLRLNNSSLITYFSKRHDSEGYSQFLCHSNLKYFIPRPRPNKKHLCYSSALFCSKYSYNYVRHYNTASLDYMQTVSVSQMKKCLKMYGLDFDDGFTCLIGDCPLCFQANKTVTKGKLFINKTTGYFTCQQCHHSGNWTLFEKLMSSKKISKQLTGKELDVLKKESVEESEAASSWKLLQKSTVPLKSVSHDLILSDFKLTISTATIDQYHIRIDEPRKTLYFPLHGCEGQIVGYKTLECDTGKENTFPPAGSSGVIGLKLGKSNKFETAILVPSLLDALSLSSQKTSCQVICLPHGLGSLPQQVLPSLERFNKLILWFGNDIGSFDTARNFAKKLDEKRCFFVRPTGSQPSPHIALCSGNDLKAIVLAAQPIWHQAITSFSSLREDVLSELQNNDKVQGVKWKRFTTLNRILKGHRRGEFTVLTGPTGSGKTTFMSEYSLDLATQGVNTLWGSFEIRNARLARTMLQQMAELPLELHVDRFDSFADQFEKLPIYFMTFHGQQSVKVVMEAVEHATYVHDIGHVIIDNVQFMMGVSDESKHMDRFWKQDAIIASFRSFATKKNCHVTLVIHPRKERDAEDLTTNSIFGGAKAAQEADNVLIIQDKRLTSVRGKKYLQIAKNRYSGDLGVMPLEFDKDRLSYGNRKKKTTESIDES